MRLKAIVSFLIIFSFYNTKPQDYKQIFTNDSVVLDTFFNETIIEDPYRWLEDVRCDSAINWVKNQNHVSKKFLAKSVSRTNAFTSIDHYAYTEYSNPVKKGKYYFTYGYYNNVGVPALFYKSALKHDAELLVDPNFISKKDKIMIKGYSVSGDSKLLAYQFNRNGSDWTEVKVVNLQYATHKEDHLTGLKFSNIAWLGNGFFYSTYYQESEFGESIRPQVYYHEIGTSQDEDKLIFERKNNPRATFRFKTTSNQRFFVLKERDEQLGKVNVFYIDYSTATPHLKPLVLNLKEDIGILDSHEGKFIVETIHDANKGSIVEIDPAEPYKWRSIIREYDEALLMYSIPFSDRILNVYQLNQQPLLTVYDYSGNLLYKLDFPVATSLGGFNGAYSDEEVLFNFRSYTIPPVVYKFNIKTFKKELTKLTTVTFDFNKIEYKEIEYTSEDSVQVPMILVYEKGLELNGNNPTILKAYGGFGSVNQPYFDPGIVHFIKKGGVFAFANIRGGGDKGSKWAEAGKGDNKQNSFDDFIAAAEYLINSNYTNTNKLAITGASNGGLVVAASAIQRPDLFKVVVPIVAPFDMIRFEKFTVGHFHTDEYGTVKDSLSFSKLYNYSPYHNIKEDINYPAFLIVTAENDDRVPPFHSYKFTAKMQSRTVQTNPIILKTEKNAGHYGANTFYSTIEETADIIGFIMNILTPK